MKLWEKILTRRDVAFRTQKEILEIIVDEIEIAMREMREEFDKRFDSPAGFLMREENADLEELLVGEGAIFDAFFSKCLALRNAAYRLNESDPGGRRDIAFDDCEDYLDQATRLFAELKRRAEREEE